MAHTVLIDVRRLLFVCESLLGFHKSRNLRVNRWLMPDAKIVLVKFDLRISKHSTQTELIRWLPRHAVTVCRLFNKVLLVCVSSEPENAFR